MPTGSNGDCEAWWSYCVQVSAGRCPRLGGPVPGALLQPCEHCWASGMTHTQYNVDSEVLELAQAPLF